jgi:drug/metabolite transporter (DMT)-like permease
MVLITTLEPVCNPIWVYLVLGEKPGAWALIGGFVVLAGIVARSALPALRRR